MSGGTTVLYVGEHSDSVASELSRSFEGTVVVVESARTAVERLGSDGVDCVVSEQALPDASGIALLRVVRERWPDLPFVLCPVDGSEQLASEALAAGVTEYVPLQSSPPDPQRVVAAADTAVQEGGTSQLQQYEQLFEHAPVMYAVTRDRGGEPVVEDCNERFLDRLGYAREHVIGRSLAALYTEGSVRKLTNGGYERALGGAFSPERRRLRAADGEVVETMLYASPRANDEGEVVGTLSMYIDHTERKRREDRLELFRSLLDQSNDEVFVLDPQSGDFVDVNRTACRRLGYDRTEMLEMNVRDVSVSFPDRESWRDHVQEVTDAGPLIFEDEHRRADGSTFPVEVNVTLVALDGEYAVAIARDLSERKRQQRRFRALIENATDLITVVEPDGTITYQSPSIEWVLGYDPEIVTGDTLFEYVHPEDHDRVSNAVAETADGPRREVYRAKHADGTWRVLEAVIDDQLADPAIGGYVVNSRDITERKDRERQLAAIDRVLRHNVRNDMDVVVGYAEAIKSQSEGEVFEAASTIREQGLGLLETIEKERDIVEVLIEGTNRSAVDLPKIVEEVVESVRESYPAAAVHNDVSGEFQALSSRDHLAQAVCELVENAVMHSDRREPTVEVTAEVDDETVTLEVADDGPGIPEAEGGVLTRDQEVAPLFHGSGMGLWLVNWIVEQSGGSLSFRRRDPRGSVVTVDLPRPRRDAVEPTESAPVPDGLVADYE
jgi:PAS domain S-box-containing protein